MTSVPHRLARRRAWPCCSRRCSRARKSPCRRSPRASPISRAPCRAERSPASRPSSPTSRPRRAVRSRCSSCRPRSPRRSSNSAFAWRMHGSWAARASMTARYLIVAKNDRRVRIEVGHGLGGRAAGRHRQPHHRPRRSLRISNWGTIDGGVEAGVDQMISVVNGEPLPEPDRKWERHSGLGHLLAAAAGGGVRRERRTARHVRPAVRIGGHRRA